MPHFHPPSSASDAGPARPCPPPSPSSSAACVRHFVVCWCPYHPSFCQIRLFVPWSLEAVAWGWAVGVAGLVPAVPAQGCSPQVGPPVKVLLLSSCLQLLSFLLAAPTIDLFVFPPGLRLLHGHSCSLPCRHPAAGSLSSHPFFLIIIL